MKFSKKVILMLFIALFVASSFAVTRSVHAVIINVVPGLNAIQNAVNIANPGDIINVAPGIYPEAITISAPHAPISLIGAPGAIIQPTAANPPQDGKDRDGIYITANGVTVQGFVIDGTNGFVTINGIYGLNTNGLTLTGNVIHDMVNNAADNGGLGILIFGWGASCNNNAISSNKVYNTDRMGIIICAMQSSSPWDWLICSGNTISGNLVYNTWQGSPNDGGGGIQVNGAKNTVIADNQVHDTKTVGSSWLKTGIYVYGSDIGNGIRFNDVYNNKYGIVTWIDAGGGVVGLVATTPMTENNNIYQNTALGVYNVAAPTLDATNNWWDSKDGPGGVGPGHGDHVTANVDYSSYLSSPAIAPHCTLTVTSAQDSPTTTTSNIVVGANIAPPGWIVTASVTSPVTVGGSYYDCTGWTGTGDVTPLGTGTTTTFTITQNSGIVWNWVVSYYLQTFSSSGLAGDATGNLVSFSVSGGSYFGTSPIGVAGGNVWVQVGATFSYTFVNPVTSSTAGKQYRYDSVTGPLTGYTVTSANTITGNYVTQYQFSVASPHDTPTPYVSGSTTWIDSGTLVTESVTTPADQSGGTRYRCTGYTGTGDLASGGSGNSVSFTISQPTSVTFNWIVQYQLTVTSAYDTPTGDGWYDTGSTATSSVTSPWPVTGGEEMCMGWTGTGSAPSGTSPPYTTTFTITQPSGVTWNWHYVAAIGGEWNPIPMQTTTPISTIGLLAPWIALALLAAGFAVAAYRRLLKKHW